MRNTVVIFARVPRLGAVKRRLAREIGDRAALDFHTRSLARLAGELARDRRFRSLLALTPDRARGALPRLPCVPQGPGNLGERMDRACRHLARGRVVVIGCDIPEAGAADVQAAFRSLASGADAVFGPAEDGGYWLVGLSPRRPARPFAKVRWSTEHALSDTLANFVGRRVAFLRRLRDVDTAADLRRSPAVAHTAGRRRRPGAVPVHVDRLASVPVRPGVPAPRADRFRGRLGDRLGDRLSPGAAD